MNTKEEDSQELTYLLKELSVQIDLLVTKRNAVELAAKHYAKEIDELRKKQREVAQKIRELETIGCSMWENIGDGG